MKPKDKLDDKLSATSFFAKLREKTLGPLVRKRSPTPPPVIFIQEDGHSQSSITEITLDESPIDISSPPFPPPDDVDGDKSRTAHYVTPSEPQSSKYSHPPLPPNPAESNNLNGGSMMQLPFLPGMDSKLTPLMALSNAQAASYNSNSQDGFPSDSRRARVKNVSITKDLPMPPGK